ncbi:MAG: glycosyltransferase family 4 protein [Chloroflexi bacterium]|nr:glycosyltransferase family 4 protein [Chloroflexota bacterium]
MRIAQVAPPYESVPPARYGGTERIVSLLTEELVRRGHDVTLFASGDSTTTARLIPTVDTALWRQDEVRDDLPYWAITLGEVYRRARHGEFDVVHSHMDFHAFPCASLVDTPTVTTLHGRLDLPDLARIFARFPEQGVVSISDSQRWPLPWATWLGTVYNAVDVEALPFNDTGGGYLAFCGRISPEKRLDAAIRIARAAGLPLKVAARMPIKDTRRPDVQRDWEYYEDAIKPLLRESDVELLGEIGDAEKPALYGNALAVLFPIDWPEPFGLVMAESLACGTPVIARRRGSVPEVLRHGDTGLIGETDDELTAFCAQISALDRAACRAEAERRFSPAAMADGYEAAYDKAIHQAQRRSTLYFGPANRQYLAADDLSELTASDVIGTVGAFQVAEVLETADALLAGGTAESSDVVESDGVRESGNALDASADGSTPITPSPRGDDPNDRSAAASS